jgi:hypothetical protein
MFSKRNKMRSKEVMNMYVIYLSTETQASRGFNNYGYWTGKSYVVQGESFPITVDYRNEYSAQGHKIKVYKSKKVAENSAKKAFDKFGHVVSVVVENYEDVPEMAYPKMLKSY